jgi:hypothetical protein
MISIILPGIWDMNKRYAIVTFHYGGKLYYNGTENGKPVFDENTGFFYTDYSIASRVGKCIEQEGVKCYVTRYSEIPQKKSPRYL